jgi:hypothetical protein
MNKTKSLHLLHLLLLLYRKHLKNQAPGNSSAHILAGKDDLMETVIYIPFKNAALDYAGQFLVNSGITATSMAGSDVTHLLLPVPAFHYEEDLDRLLRQLPDAVCIIGGSLNHSNPEKYPMIDLLQDPFYLAENAAITAHCALKYIWNALPVTLEGQPVLIIG